MTELTPEKMEELTALVAKAPPETAVRLVMMFERAKVKGSQIIPSQDVLSAIRGAGFAAKLGKSKPIPRLPSFERLFFEPFEHLFEDGTFEQVLPGNLPRAGLHDVWTLIATKIAKEAVLRSEPMGRDAILSGDLHAARILTQELRDTIHAKLVKVGVQEEIKALAKSAQAHATLARLPALFAAERHGRDIWPDAFGPRGTLSDKGVDLLSDAVRVLENSDPEAARELLLLTMCNMPRPNDVLRVLTKVSTKVDDRKLDMTEFSVIGRRLIAMAQRCALEIEAAALTGQFEAQALVRIIDRFNQNLNGLERDAQLTTDGPWRRLIVEVRAKTSKCLARMCERGAEDVEAVLPMRRNQGQALAWSHVLKLDKAIDPHNLDHACRYLNFVSEARLFAPLAGFGAARDEAAKQAANHLDRVQEALIRCAKDTNRPPHFESWWRATATLLAALDGNASADLFERRIQAAQPKSTQASAA